MATIGTGKSLALIRDGARKLADAESKLLRHPDTDLNEYINESIRAALGLAFFNSRQPPLERLTGTIDQTNSLIPKPDDLQRLHYVMLNEGSNFWTLEPFAEGEAAALHNVHNNGLYFNSGRPLYYRMSVVDCCGEAITLLPPADKAYNYTLLFVPTMCPLVEGDVLNYAISELFDWIECDVAAKISIKDGDSKRLAMCEARKAEVQRRLEMYARRIVSGPIKRRDTRFAFGSYRDWRWRWQ